jgi:hypothetical protein
VRASNICNYLSANSESRFTISTKDRIRKGLAP